MQNNLNLLKHLKLRHYSEVEEQQTQQSEHHVSPIPYAMEEEVELDINYSLSA